MRRGSLNQNFDMVIPNQSFRVSLGKSYFDVLTIRARWKEGATRKELYEAYPQVSQVSIRDIINGKTWKHLL